MLPDRVSNPGPLTYKSGALPIALCRMAHGHRAPHKRGTEDKFKGTFSCFSMKTYVVTPH